DYNPEGGMDVCVDSLSSPAIRAFDDGPLSLHQRMIPHQLIREPELNRRRASILKWVVSLLVLYHLLAVVLPPLAFQTTTMGERSPLLDRLIRPFEGYGQFLYLDRGYAFFAPDPGPSHLFQAAVGTDEGTLKETLYPNLELQWPRLLYHRHFMLAEFLNEIYVPPGPPNDLVETDPQAAMIWRQQRGRYEWVRQSIVDHLSHVHNGSSAAIIRVEHGIPSLSDYRAEPIALDDERLYGVLLDQPLISDEMAPTRDTELIPSPVNEDTSEENMSRQEDQS
ncbi:MAG: hypothetical protein AAGJ83_04295, partial [Planctomycetota bacterium]